MALAPQTEPERQPSSTDGPRDDLAEFRRVRDLIESYPEVLTAHEAAVVLRTSESNLNRLIRRGEVPAHKVGGQWRLSKTALLTALTGTS